MLSKSEKQIIAQEVEKLLLGFNHPEMPKERPYFRLHVNGKEGWSFADIEPNWIFKDREPSINLWNEIARQMMKGEKESS